MEALLSPAKSAIPTPASFNNVSTGEMQKSHAKEGDVNDSIFQSVFYQPKLSIGSPDDPLEREADNMADHVMRMSMPEPIKFSSAKNTVSRACSQCEKDKDLHRKEGSHESPSFAPSIVHDVLNSGGRSLDVDTRSYMEPRFNYDFSNVKIHDNDLAAKSASSINALAYTSGNNVVFNSGQYNTNSDSGKRLLAHELTHVVQQGKGITRKLQRFTAACRGLLNSPVGSMGRVLTGTAIHYAIMADFASMVTGGLSGLGIPGSSAAPLRTAGLCAEDIPTIAPQIIGGRAGMGYPDLAARIGGILHVAEIKPASWNCAIDGTFQLGGYVQQGNARDPEQIAWRASQSILSVVPMLPSIYPGKTLVIGDYTIIIEWCLPGLLVYQVIGSNRREPIRQPIRQPADRRNPYPVLVRERSTWEIIKRFAEESIRAGQTGRETIVNFLRQHPQLINLIIAAGIAGLVATFAEDIATAGVGILDDLVTVPFFARLISIALELRQSLALATTGFALAAE